MGTHRLNVLFADPEADWFSNAAGVLAPHGIHAVQVRTGREALRRIEDGDIHVAVLDQTLPQLSGLQVVKLSREIKAAPPAILLAKDCTSNLMHEALVMKVFSVLRKPVDLDLLLETLARVVKRKYEGRWPEVN
ncbi:MAG: response regulator [Proteobacteria bacterium]|nr:MAG: response regulator [Pseudomonadota bacterium]